MIGWLLWVWLIHCIVCVLYDWLEWLLWVLIGSLYCLCPLWLARVITLDFSLVHCIVCVHYDWLEWLLWVLIGPLSSLCPLWLSGVISLGVWLVHCIVCVLYDWLEWLLFLCVVHCIVFVLVLQHLIENYFIIVYFIALNLEKSKKTAFTNPAFFLFKILTPRLFRDAWSNSDQGTLGQRIYLKHKLH